MALIVLLRYPVQCQKHILCGVFLYWAEPRTLHLCLSHTNQALYLAVHNRHRAFL